MTPNPSLNHERVVVDGASPDRWLLVLHGIYGAGRNWNSVVRRFVDARPDWGGVPVDLRQHGDSQGFPPPHGLQAAAGDLRRLVEEESLDARAVLGHSFGGKVALVYARDPAVPLEKVWVMDSTPDAREPSGSAWGMLQVLKDAPRTFSEREEGVQALVDRGVARPIALWMATNLTRTGDGFHWRIDPTDMETLLLDFFRTDTWDVVEDPPEGLRIHFVKAEDSPVLDDEAAERVEAAGRRSGRVFLHRVAGGHWLNADNPDAVVDLLAENM